MKGYPPGTKCVITWAAFEPFEIARIGDLVDVIGPAEIDKYDKNLLVQPVDPNSLRDRDEVIGAMRAFPGWEPAWPVSWMRPLEDPDTQEVPEEQEVSA